MGQRRDAKKVVVVVALGGRCGAVVVDARSDSWLRGVTVSTLESESSDEAGPAERVGEGGSRRVGALCLTHPFVSCYVVHPCSSSPCFRSV